MGIVRLTAYVSLEGEQSAKDQASGLRIEINPRYGAWDADELTVMGSGSLSGRSEG